MNGENTKRNSVKNKFFTPRDLCLRALDTNSLCAKDVRRNEDLYGTKKTPRLITLPKQKYITINGKGNPNNEDFSNRVSALYALAYAVKAEYKAVAISDGFSGKICDFTVYPLEDI